MSDAARQAAAAAALLTPAAITIGKYHVRPFSGGDVLLGLRLGLVLASNEKERIALMTLAEQTLELLTIGALMCHPEERLKLALWQSADTLRAEVIAPVLFSLSAEDTAKLIEYVTVFFKLAADVQFDVEERPSDAPAGPEPTGNA